MLKRIVFVSLLLVAVSSRAAEVGIPLHQTLTPEGKQIALPKLRPQVIALSPDGTTLVTSGKNNELIVLDPATGEIRQRVVMPGKVDVNPKSVSEHILQPDKTAQVSFTGLAFAPDGRRIYLSDVNGTIKTFSVAADGRVAGLRSFPLPDVTTATRKQEIPAGIAVSADGKRLYVALNLSNSVAEMDADTGAIIRRFNVGVAPYDVALVGKKLCVSNWGGRRPGWTSATALAGRGTTVRADPVRFIACEGSVSVINLATGKITAELLTGLHASGLACSPDGKHLLVANANSDTVSVIETATDKIIETILLRWSPDDLFGASPNALVFAPDGKTFYVCNGTQNAVAVVAFAPGKSRVEGLIPVGWFPGAITFDARRNAIYVANIKGKGSGSSGFAPETGEYIGFNSHQHFGTLSLVPTPDAARLKTLTQTVLANYRRSVMAAALLPARPGQPPRAVPERVGEPSVFRHVIYIIKENRTYDQVLGDMKEGNGDERLCTFGEKFTPNQHKISREFVLLDNTFCSGILSADGHQWATSSFVTDYLEKEFAGFPRSYPDGTHPDALAYSPTGFIWDNVIAHGKTLRNYGEFMDSTVAWKDPKRVGKPCWIDAYNDFIHKTGLIRYSSTPNIASLARHSRLNTAGWEKNVPDIIKADLFIQDLRAAEKTGDLPHFIILYLPNDHTFGTRAGGPTPGACVADNDLAVGRVIEALSHSRFWKNTCVFAIEDDPQNGYDHVSAYRTTAYVASAYTKRRAVVSAKYTQPSLLRTMELILGLPPMNQLDATAAPMTECFNDTPDFTPYDAAPNNIPIDQLNPAPHTLTDPVLRRDAMISAKLPLSAPDRCPEIVLNKILWRAQKGSRAPYPDWAAIPDAKDDDD
jgi:YVTN family beta-propeller protein